MHILPRFVLRLCIHFHSVAVAAATIPRKNKMFYIKSRAQSHIRERNKIFPVANECALFTSFVFFFFGLLFTDFFSFKTEKIVARMKWKWYTLESNHIHTRRQHSIDRSRKGKLMELRMKKEVENVSIHLTEHTLTHRWPLATLITVWKLNAIHRFHSINGLFRVQFWFQFWAFKIRNNEELPLDKIQSGGSRFCTHNSEQRGAAEREQIHLSEHVDVTNE